MINKYGKRYGKHNIQCVSILFSKSNALIMCNKQWTATFIVSYNQAEFNMNRTQCSAMSLVCLIVSDTIYSNAFFQYTAHTSIYSAVRGLYHFTVCRVVQQRIYCNSIGLPWLLTQQRAAVAFTYIDELFSKSIIFEKFCLSYCTS